MRTKNLFKIISGFALLVLAFCLTGCPDPFQNHIDPFSEGLAVRSARFYFTNVSDGQLQCVYEYSDNDGCCHTPAEKVDTFRLMSDHLYVCLVELNGEDPKTFCAGTGASAIEYFFSFSPGDDLGLIIDSPDIEDKNYFGLCSNWITGKPGNGIVNFKIGHCPDNFFEEPCYEISLPVVIK